jgi:PelA/Pel-15E family pectate lyase
MNFLLSFLVMAFAVTAYSCDEAKLVALKIKSELYLQAVKEDKNAHLEAFSFYRDFASCEEGFYASEDALQIAKNLETFQHPLLGAWDKHILHDGFFANEKQEFYHQGTFDNNQTTGQLEFILRVLVHYNFTNPQDELLLLNSLNKGVKYILDSQYKSGKDSGGFPQVYPLPKDYQRFVTFNDHAMINVMSFLYELNFNPIYQDLILPKYKLNLVNSYAQGFEYILKAQIKQEGKLTVWAQQYENLKPARARSYELPGLATHESLGVIEFLEKENQRIPNSRIQNALQSAKEWFERSKYRGIDHRYLKDKKNPRCELIPEVDSKQVWARYYDLESNKPFFAYRTKTNTSPENKLITDGTIEGICQAFNEYAANDQERASGYAWFLVR